MQARVGDRIVVDSVKMDVPPRTGEVLEVIPHDPHPEFRVRWDNGHETAIRPPEGSYRIQPSLGVPKG